MRRCAGYRLMRRQSYQNELRWAGRWWQERDELLSPSVNQKWRAKADGMMRHYTISGINWVNAGKDQYRAVAKTETDVATGCLINRVIRDTCAGHEGKQCIRSSIQNATEQVILRPTIFNCSPNQYP